MGAAVAPAIARGVGTSSIGDRIGMTGLMWADYALIGIVGLSALVSLVRGFVREALALLGWVAAVWVVVSFTESASTLFADHVETPSVRFALTAVILFVGVLVLCAIAVYLMGLLVDRTGLTGTDRVLGVVFGAARGVIIAGLLVMLAGLTPLPRDRWWRESALIPHFEQVAVRLRSLLPEEIGRFIEFSDPADSFTPIAPVLKRDTTG